MVRDIKCLQGWRLQIRNQLATCTRNILYSKHGNKVKNCICLICFLVFTVFILTVYSVKGIYEIFCGRRVDCGMW